MAKFNNVRIQHKRDTAENWAKAINFIPLAGEIVVYTDLNKIKIGDGESTINELEFSGGDSGVMAPLVATNTNGTLDKTGAEIKAALEAGRPVFVTRSIGNGSQMYPVVLGKEEIMYDYAIYAQGVRSEVDDTVTYDQSAQYLIIDVYVCTTLSGYMTHKDNTPK